MEENKQQDCEVCTGKGVVENGVCRNCGDGKPKDQVPPKAGEESSSNGSGEKETE